MNKHEVQNIINELKIRIFDLNRKYQIMDRDFVKPLIQEIEKLSNDIIENEKLLESIEEEI